MTRGRCWGVYRELAHSPGRETDDAEILRATARELSALGFDVELKSPDDLDGDAPPNVFVMCERIPVVDIGGREFDAPLSAEALERALRSAGAGAA